ncbi:MAG TPA: hypothetical protein VFT87_04115 [Candidatus Saccharimonadales bacterium]|nr:hypothetical protein [Candidatus Saccharimonadales bacterium]
MKEFSGNFCAVEDEIRDLVIAARETVSICSLFSMEIIGRRDFYQNLVPELQARAAALSSPG